MKSLLLIVCLGLLVQVCSSLTVTETLTITQPNSDGSSGVSSTANGFTATAAANSITGATYVSTTYSITSAKIVLSSPTDTTVAGTFTNNAGNTGTTASGSLFQYLPDLLVTVTDPTGTSYYQSEFSITDNTASGTGETGYLSATFIQAGTISSATGIAPGATGATAGTNVPKTTNDPNTPVTSSPETSTVYLAPWHFTITYVDHATISAPSTAAFTNGASSTINPHFSGNVVATYTYTLGVSGDPQFVGFQGQHYQIHGTPDEHFNLISSTDFFLNAKFVYMANGNCNYNETECFSHPGTYIGRLGFVSGDSHVSIVSGAHSVGLSVFINSKVVAPSTRIILSNSSSIYVTSTHRAVLQTNDFKISVVNSDMFLNMGAEFTNQLLLKAGQVKTVIPTSSSPAQADKILSTTYPEYLLHGLLGQTWRNIVWPHARLYQGEPTDYQVTDLFSPEFLYRQSE